jgi:5-formyltetrahydrofolate cyclo-ligase
LKEKKTALRAAVKAAVRREPNGAARDLSCSLAIERIEDLPEFASARTVALYHALPGEAPTDEMLRRWLGVKRLALPVISGKGEMFFREYTGPECLIEGAFGIREPAPPSYREAQLPRSSRARHEVPTRDLIPPSEIDLAIIPGIAFDAAGRRLGRGGGFYDRYLAHPGAAHIYKVGLCLPRALVAEVPAEAHDVAMNRVITFG